MSINAIGTTAAETTQSAAATAANKTQVNKEAFLQMLVAQIKNQNPLNPADGVQFLSQLAQFSELEQMMDVRGELVQIREQITSWQAAQQNTEDSGATQRNV